MLELTTIPQWQLRKLVDVLSYSMADIREEFPGFQTQAYYVRDSGVDWVEASGGRLRVVKTLSKSDLQYHRDVFFTHPHRALQVVLDHKVLVIGFWCQELDRFMEWLKEMLPDVDTNFNSERVLAGCLHLG